MIYEPFYKTYSNQRHFILLGLFEHSHIQYNKPVWCPIVTLTDCSHINGMLKVEKQNNGESLSSIFVILLSFVIDSCYKLC